LSGRPRAIAAGRSELVLVIGDLSLDVHTTVPSLSLLDPLANGDDVTIYAGTGLAVGGSAWQFARAILDGTQTEPVVLAAVGADPAGATVREALRQAGLRVDGVPEVAGATTGVSSLTYFEHRQRLMVFPSRHANHELSAADAMEVLSTLPSDQVACAWLSGHALLDERSARRATTVAVCAWTRHHGVPLVLDLVPHDFAGAVGSLARVEDLIGPIDGLVGELGTLRGLGYPTVRHPAGDGGDGTGARTDPDRELMAAIATELSVQRRFAVVQHRAAQDIYVQILAHDGQVRTTEYHIAARGLRGLGDAMAVDGLIDVGVLAAARTRY
jgi:sugar/nucleoside kinase (ribokinase family)